MAFTDRQIARLRAIKASLEAGYDPLIDHKLIAEQTSTLAATVAGDMIPVRPYANGVIVSVEGFAYASGGDAEADTMDVLMPDKYMGALISIGGKPKTNSLYEALFTLCSDRKGGFRRVFWPIEQGELFEVTFKNKATAGIAAMKAIIAFGFIPFDVKGE
jgi:hypothetical protein